MDLVELTRQMDPSEVADLLAEVGEKNTLCVTKHEMSRLNPRRRAVRKQTMKEEFKQASACLPSLLRIDQLRIATGKKPMFLDAAIRRINGGELVSVGFNLRTNVGIDFVALQLGGTATTTTADYLAVSNNTTAPNATHTSATIPWSSAQAADAAAGASTGEYTALGVARKQATYAHTAGVASYTQSATWTATGTVTALTKAGLFGGAAKNAQGNGATNILFLENTFTSTSLANGDQLSLTWTVNI